MTTRIKNWAKFQHFKDRRPPWVKLYRDLLDDMEWHELDAHAAKALVMFWLISSESEGDLPDAKTLAFRLRTTERNIADLMGKLSHWLEHDGIDPISGVYRGDTPETEERESRERDRQARFDQFWSAYPKKVGKGAAEKAFRKVDVPGDVLVAAIRAQEKSEQWCKDQGRYIPHPSTWLNEKRWLDVQQVGAGGEWHETSTGVQARAAELGIGPWIAAENDYPTYKRRVMDAHAKGAH